jgi:hypothetical protein
MSKSLSDIYGKDFGFNIRKTKSKELKNDNIERIINLNIKRKDN